jgi:hypothetical protein
MLDKNSMGLDGFVWFFGIVEGRQDPLTLGRIRVRAFGWHDDSLAAIPTEHLPWAQCIGGRDTDMQYRDGDMVFGFFSDGRSAQKPFIMGLVNGMFSVPNDTGKGFNDLRQQSELKTAPRFIQSAQYQTDGSGIKITEQSAAPHHPSPLELNNPTITGVAFNKPTGTVIAQRQHNLDTNIKAAGQTWSEPKPAYAPVYPYDSVYASESGHVVEVDDTPGHERIAFQHRTGSFIEWMPTGSVVEKVTKTKYSIIMGDDNVHVMGKCRITVSGDAYIQVVGDCNLEVNNDLNAGVAGDANFSVAGGFNVKAASVAIESDGSLNLKSGGGTNLDSGGDLNLKGDTTKVGGGSYASMVAGTVQLDGYVTIKQGGQKPSGGSGASVPSAPSKETASNGTPSSD